MKTHYFILVLVLGVISLQSCENDDNNLHSGNQLVEKAFTEKYPDASRIDWEQKGNYSVVDFRKSNNDVEAWFDQNGIWYMTETDLLFEALPDAVKNTFSASEYKTWRIDDIDMIERKDMETIYVLEVESGKQECDLYYSTDGTLIKFVTDTHNNGDNEHYLPPTLSSDVNTYISSHYPQARILETENEHGMIEVDILDGTTHRELLFNTNGEWAHTKTPVKKNALPQAINSVLQQSEFASYTIDDIYYYETPQRNYYYFELESRSKEVDLIITLEGNIEVVKISND